MTSATTTEEGVNRSVYFAEGDLTKLDALAKEADLSRSKFIREMINKRWQARERRVSKA